MLPLLPPHTHLQIMRQFRSNRDIEIENDEARAIAARRAMGDEARILASFDTYHPDPLGAALSSSLDRFERAIAGRLEAFKLTVSRFAGSTRGERAAASGTRDLLGPSIRTQNARRGDGC